MTPITEKQIFEAIRAKTRPDKLTQTTVDITHIAIDTPEGLNKLLDYLGMYQPPKPIERAYKLTPETLRAVYPTANVDVIPFILKYADNYGITSKKQMCAFIATCLLESQGFNAKRENMNYSAKKLVETFSKALIPDLKFATSLVKQGPVAIANHLYNGRMGNRIGTNDGWEYRGNSWIQLTGREGHYLVQTTTGFKVGDNPKLLEQLEIACQVTMDWWQLKGLNIMADKINVYKDGYTLNTLNSKGVETHNHRMNTGAVLVRQTVNGGMNGFEDFCKYLVRCMKHM